MATLISLVLIHLVKQKSMEISTYIESVTIMVASND